MPVTDNDLDAAADGYATILRAHAGDPPRLDVVHLGLGSDGHTASLAPGEEALEVIDRDVVTTGFYRSHWRMTMSPCCLAPVTSYGSSQGARRPVSSGSSWPATRRFPQDASRAEQATLVADLDAALLGSSAHP
jgi:6-phosphogluconolactonase